MIRPFRFRLLILLDRYCACLGKIMRRSALPGARLSGLTIALTPSMLESCLMPLRKTVGYELVLPSSPHHQGLPPLGRQIVIAKQLRYGLLEDCDPSAEIVIR